MGTPVVEACPWGEVLLQLTDCSFWSGEVKERFKKGTRKQKVAGVELRTTEAADMARVRHEVCLAVARGEFVRGIALARKLRGECGTSALGLAVQVIGAIGAGDVQTFDETVNAIRASANPEGIVSVFLRLFLGEQGNVPLWLEQFNFRHLPLEERFGGGCLSVRYLFVREEWKAADAGAATLLNFCEQEPLMDLLRTWLHLVCAISLENLGIRERAFERYRQSVRTARVLEVVLPFLDQPLGPRTLLERALAAEAPDLLTKIRRQSPEYFRNLQKFHNRFAGEQREEMLSPREAQLAHLLMADCAYKQIAERLDISFSRVRNLISALYEKLGIHRRSEIERRVW